MKTNPKQLGTQIAQAEARLAELETRYNNIPEQVRQSSQAKQEQWQAFRQKADKVTTSGLYIAIVLALIFIWKKIRKLFKWAEKKNDETLEKAHERIEKMAAELKANELEQKTKNQTSDQESEKKAINVVVNLAPPTNNPNGENNNQPLTKVEPKAPPKIPEKAPAKPKKIKTLAERERDRKNAKRRARYQLKKMLSATVNDNKKNEPNTKLNETKKPNQKQGKN